MEHLGSMPAWGQVTYRIITSSSEAPHLYQKGISYSPPSLSILKQEVPPLV